MKKSGKADSQGSKNNYFESRVYNNDSAGHNSLMLVQSNQDTNEGHHPYINQQNRHQ